MEIESICQPCNGNPETQQNLIDFLLPSNLTDAQSSYKYSWYHTGDFRLEKIKHLFEVYLFYRHLDLRKQSSYERVSHVTYLQDDAANACLLNENNKAKKKNM